MIFSIQNKDDLAKKLVEAGDKLVVIDFFANWCGPCKIISPKLEELSELYNGKAIVLKVDVDDCEDIAMEYNITSMPTFVFMKHSQVIETFVGGNSEKLTKNMEKLMSEGTNYIEKEKKIPDVKSSAEDFLSDSSGIEESLDKKASACGELVAKSADHEGSDTTAEDEASKNTKDDKESHKVLDEIKNDNKPNDVKKE